MTVSNLRASCDKRRFVNSGARCLFPTLSRSFPRSRPDFPIQSPIPSRKHKLMYPFLRPLSSPRVVFRSVRMRRLPFRIFVAGKGILGIGEDEGARRYKYKLASRQVTCIARLVAGSCAKWINQFSFLCKELWLLSSCVYRISCNGNP